jgi:hypothetical protein
MKKTFVIVSLVALVVGAALAGEHMVGGTGTSNNTIPFWGGRSDPGMRWQSIWLQSEINEAGQVTKIEWQNWASGTGSGGTFNTCKMYLCHTTLAAVTSVFNDNYGGNTPVEVFSGTFVIPSLPANTWHTICSPTNFSYNNSNNLLMEVTWVGPSTGGTTPFKTSTTGPGRVYAWNWNASSGSVTSSYAQYGRITITPAQGIAPTSLGRIKGLYR